MRHAAISICHVAYVNEPCHKYKYVMWHTRMSHITHQSNCQGHPHLILDLRQFQRLTSNIRICHIARIAESRHTHEGVMWQISMGHVTHLSNHRWHPHLILDPRRFQRVMSHIWMCHTACIAKSCPTPRTWTRHVTNINGSCHTPVKSSRTSISNSRSPSIPTSHPSHIWMCRIARIAEPHPTHMMTNINGSCHTLIKSPRTSTFNSRSSSIPTRHVTYRDVSYRTHMNASCDKYQWVMSHTCQIIEDIHIQF